MNLTTYSTCSIQYAVTSGGLRDKRCAVLLSSDQGQGGDATHRADFLQYDARFRGVLGCS